MVAVTTPPGATDGIRIANLCRLAAAFIFSSLLLNSAVEPPTLTAEISAAGLIRRVSVLAGAFETFLSVKIAFTVRTRSVSPCGRAALMSYFWTCQVADAAVVSWPKPWEQKIAANRTRKKVFAK